jgi:hypothetical protein
MLYCFQVRTREDWKKPTASDDIFDLMEAYVTCDLEIRRKQMPYLDLMDRIVEDQTRERPREAKVHRQMRWAGTIREGWVSRRVRWLAAYLRSLPPILARRWKRVTLPPVAAHDTTPEAACCD